MLKDLLFNGIKVATYKSTGDHAKDLVITKEILNDLGLHQNVSLNDSMFQQAYSFASVANKIYDESFKKSPYKGLNTAPFVVNAVFSVELYLKTILHAYGHNSKVHNLSKIYKNIPNQGKEFINITADEIKPRYKLEEGTTILTILDNLSMSFEHWRYIYEHNKLSIEIQSIRYLMHTSHESCCRVRNSIATE